MPKLLAYSQNSLTFTTNKFNITSNSPFSTTLHRTIFFSLCFRGVASDEGRGNIDEEGVEVSLHGGFDRPFQDL
ncbi:hypothetical protein HanRHA438_Chr15g0701871 [Helianthus annuus]|nr:hypothetical protein HanIR_Chr15g0749331 [Helianthus annuus]KAJ0844388.1 hypothetical protein HanRHA438_Chr15g0701871 [Helianthus annuus]